MYRTIGNDTNMRMVINRTKTTNTFTITFSNTITCNVFRKSYQKICFRNSNIVKNKVLSTSQTFYTFLNTLTKQNTYTLLQIFIPLALRENMSRNYPFQLHSLVCEKVILYFLLPLPHVRDAFIHPRKSLSRELLTRGLLAEGRCNISDVEN